MYAIYLSIHFSLSLYIYIYMYIYVYIYIHIINCMLSVARNASGPRPSRSTRSRRSAAGA